MLHVTVCYMLQCVTCYSVLPTGHSRPVTDDLLASFRDTVQVKPVTAGVRCEGRHHSQGIIGIIVLASCVMCHAVSHCISVFHCPYIFLESPSVRYLRDVTCLVMCNVYCVMCTVYCVLYSVASDLGSGGCAGAGCRRPAAPAPPGAGAGAGWAR